MKPTKEQLKNFLNKELDALAKVRSTVAIDEQKDFDDIEAKKIKYARN